jgi:anaerobic selenocysteine-containing dehydrogenase
MCGLEISVSSDGKVSGIRGDDKDPLSHGHICPKAVAIQDIHTDPDRLKTPLKKTSDGWVDVSWEDAFDDIASRIKQIRSQYSRNAVGVYQGNPTVHNTGTVLFAPRLFRALRTRSHFSATSVDQLPHHISAELMFGNRLMIPIPDIDHTDFFLVLGANPVASNGSIMTAPGMARRIKDVKRRGGTVVVVDPRRSETAAIANRHLFIRPGTDVYLLLGILHTIYEEQLTSDTELPQYIDGEEVIREIVSEFPPEATAAITGVDPGSTRDIAREFCAARASVAYGRMGVSTQDHGTLCQWLINVLNSVTHNLDSRGGAMFTRPAIDIVAFRSGKDRSSRVRTGKTAGDGFAKHTTRVRGLPIHGVEYPVAALAEEILTPGAGQIRAMIVSAGNPVLSTPNGPQLEEAFRSLDFMVSIDIYLNETSRLADYILPPTTLLESGHYDLVFHIFAVRNTVKYSPRLFNAGKETRADWQIFQELYKRIRPRAKSIKSRFAYAISDRLSPERLLDIGLRKGPWGSGFFSRKGLTLKKVRRAVHGIDLGALTPCLPDRLFHPDKRVNLAPAPLPEAVRSLDVELTAPTDPQLSLIGRRHLRSNNSWMHNSERLVKGPQRCVLLIHPDDASRRGVEDGAQVRVTSRTGTVTVVAGVTTDLMPGVVSLPHGWGHHRAGTRLGVAGAHAGVSSNDLTDELRVDRLSGNAAFSATPVTVTAV